MTNSSPQVRCYGTIQIGDISLECVVLNDGTSGYVQRQLAHAIGFTEKRPGSRFRRFLAEIAPNSLSYFDKTSQDVIRLPNGATATFAPCGILTEVVAGVMESASLGTLHTQRKHLVKPCSAIYRALAKTGEAALIDEATGYQRNRAPDYLQNLFDKLLRESASDWERRFHPDFYDSVYRLFGWSYNPAKPKPFIVGKITLEWVYEPIFPPEILVEIKERQTSEKMHQWLHDGGLTLLEKQKDAVMMIARSSFDYKDFYNRCATAFFKRGQMPILYPREV